MTIFGTKATIFSGISIYWNMCRYIQTATGEDIYMGIRLDTDGLHHDYDFIDTLQGEAWKYLHKNMNDKESTKDINYCRV